jgi:hypothetical protein
MCSRIHSTVDTRGATYPFIGRRKEGTSPLQDKEIKRQQERSQDDEKQEQEIGDGGQRTRGV